MPPDHDARSQGAPVPGGWASEDSIWQLVECCGYAADLPAWAELCRDRSVLDLGCGIGRVAAHLARAGCRVTGLDLDPRMLRDFLRRTPAGTKGIQGDVLDPDLSPGRFAAVIAPQQLLQIVGGRDERARLLALLARTLEPGAVAGIAITEDLPRQSAAPVLTPDIREIDDWVYSSRPIALDAAVGQVMVTRLRQKVSPRGEITETTDQVTFRRLDPESLRPELSAAGLALKEVRAIPATDAHVASSLLVLEPAP